MTFDIVCFLDLLFVVDSLAFLYDSVMTY